MRNARWVVLVVAYAAVAACTGFDSVEQGVCGNFVLEPGEDCDGVANAVGGECAAETEEHACFYVCTEDECPAGWACGTDGRCRAPSGNFLRAEGAPWTFDVSDLAVGDVDGDGFADVLGNAGANLRVRFGSEDGGFDDLLSVKTSEPTGPISYAKFDADELLDVVVPTATGLFVLLGDAARSLEPVAFSPFNLQGLDVEILPVTGASGFTEAILFVDGDDRSIYATGTPELQYDFPAGGTKAGLRFPLSTADVDPEPDGTATSDEFVLAFQGGTSVQVIALDIDYVPLEAIVEPVLYATIPLQAGYTVAGGALFADYDGDGDQDILVAARGGVFGNEAVAVSLNTNGAFSVASVALFSPLNLKGGPRFPLAAANLSPNGRADYVYTDGIYIANVDAPPEDAGPPTSLTPSIRDNASPWLDAAIGDLNRDGALDVVLTRKGATIDAFLGAGTGLFNSFPLEAEGSLGGGRNLRVADFDGDFYDDIAFPRRDEDAGEDEFVVIFGAADARFSEPLSMGRLGDIVRVTPMLVISSQLNVTMDALVVSENVGGLGRSAAIFEGSSSRRMVSPFALSPPEGDAHTPVRAIVGDFVDNGEDRRDLIVVAEPPVGLVVEPEGVTGEPGTDGSDFVREPSIWLVPGLDGSGALDAANTNFKTIEGETQFFFEINCSTWAVGDLDGDGAGSELVGLDSQAGCVSDLVSSSASLMVVGEDQGTPTITHSEISLNGDELFNTQTLALADLDDDGDLDALASFVLGGSRGASVNILWNDSGQLSLVADPVDQIDSAEQLSSVATAHLNSDEHLDLLYLTRFSNDGNQGVAGPGSLFGLIYDPASRDYGAPVRLAEVERARLLKVGDVNGDGIDDVAVVSGDVLDVWLATPAAPLGGAR